MSSPSADLSQRLLNAALTLFARHGFQRTSMADVAAEARVARATLYARFGDKRALFEALAQSMVNDALLAAEGAWQEGMDDAANLAASVLAKDLPLYRLLHASPHGAELLAVDAELTQAHAARLDAGFTAILSRRAATMARNGAELEVFGGADGFGGLLATACAGLKHEARTEAAYRDAVRRLCRVVVRAAFAGGTASMAGAAPEG